MTPFLKIMPCAAAIVVMVAGLTVAPASFAQTAPVVSDTSTASTSTNGTTSLRSLDDGALSNARGGQVVVISNQTLKSTISGSTINGDYAAGTINFAGNALSNFSGLGNVVVNTGAQANLQSAMNLTVNLGK